MAVPSMPQREVMDFSWFKRAVEEDEAEGMCPCLMIARLGTPLTDEIDDLDRRAVDPSNTPSRTRNSSIDATYLADSVHINMGSWFGLPNLPGFPELTFFQMTDPLGPGNGPSQENAYLIDESSSLSRRVMEGQAPSRLGSLRWETMAPDTVRVTALLYLWSLVEAGGLQAIEVKILQAQELVRTFRERVSKCSGAGSSSSHVAPITGLVRFTSPFGNCSSGADVTMENSATLFIFNSLPDAFRAGLKLDTVDIAGKLHIRYRPLIVPLPPQKHAELLIPALNHISRNLSCIDSTFTLRPCFLKEVANIKELRFIKCAEEVDMEQEVAPHRPSASDTDIDENSRDDPSQPRTNDDSPKGTHDAYPSFILGALQYVPLYIDLDAARRDGGGLNMPYSVIEDLELLNENLVELLSLLISDNLEEEFEEADIDEDIRMLVGKCRGVVRFLNGDVLEGGEGAGEEGKEVGSGESDALVGPLDKTPFTEEIIQDVLALVVRVGRKLEIEGKFMDTMADWIKKGIKDAERVLRNESSGMQPRSMLRSLPVVRSVWGWLAPEPAVIQTRDPVAKTWKFTTGFATIPLLSTASTQHEPPTTEASPSEPNIAPSAEDEIQVKAPQPQNAAEALSIASLIQEAAFDDGTGSASPISDSEKKDGRLDSEVEEGVSLDESREMANIGKDVRDRDLERIRVEEFSILKSPIQVVVTNVDQAASA
ncbi:Pyridoxal-dependent decarboxylase domain-containing protein 1 [Quaeritorhiza haematococci]|nr:Pyridoxal-dependent decarboxylase domain-containing protein 1 [Quaeritorhiza haematococci]